jgi:hypothetical protein
LVAIEISFERAVHLSHYQTLQGTVQLPFFPIFRRCFMPQKRS